jgi:cytochrome c biogenesis protein CcmG, thiol:disulfide interchange protein DsbE
VVVSATGGDDDDSTAAGNGAVETRPVQVTGTPLAPFETGEQDPAVGAATPTVTGETFTGDPVTVGGKGPALVVFVAHWCPHCQREVPFLVDYFDEHGMPEGVDVFAVSTSVTDQRPNFPPSAWLARERWPAPAMADSATSEAGEAFGITSFPYFVAIDKDGKVAARGSGELERPQLEALLDAARS